MNYQLIIQDLDKTNSKLMTAFKGVLVGDAGLSISQAKEILDQTYPNKIISSSKKRELEKAFYSLKKIGIKAIVINSRNEEQDMSDLALASEEIEELTSANNLQSKSTENDLKEEIQDMSFLEEDSVEVVDDNIPEEVINRIDSEILTTLSSQMKNSSPSNFKPVKYSAFNKSRRLTSEAIKKYTPTFIKKLYEKTKEIDLGSDTLWYSLFASIFLLAINSYNISQSSEYFIDHKTSHSTNLITDIDNIIHTISGKSSTNNLSLEISATVMNKLIKNGKLILTTPKPSELTAEEIVLGRRPKAWIKEIKMDKLSFINTAKGEYVAKGLAGILINYLGDDIKKIGQVTLKGTFTEKTLSGKLNICHECIKDQKEIFLDIRDDGEFEVQINTNFLIAN